MGKLLSEYQDLLNDTATEDKDGAQSKDFWDLVVLSAGNDSQKHWYEMQLAQKLLPPGVQFRVYSDPGGVRTGDGGATLNIVELLYEEFGEDKMDR